MKLILPLLLSASLAMPCLAQDIKYETSEPVDVSLDGWNKVLLMENGNTLFFHFEPRKGVIVKVFDTTHKEIVHKKHLCKVLDINMLDRAGYKGMASVNNEALIFISQNIDNRETLIRLNIDGSTGELLKEEKLVESPTFNEKNRAYVLKTATEKNHHIVTYKNKPGYSEKQINIISFNDKHQQIRQVPLEINQEGMDYVRLEYASIDRNGGILTATEMSKIIQYPSRYEKSILLAYLPKGFSIPFYKQIQLPMSFNSYSMDFDYDNFSKKINLLLTVNVAGVEENGLDNRLVEYNIQSLITMNEDLSDATYKRFDNNKIETCIASQLDTNYKFSGNVLNMRTNNYGLTTVIYFGKAQNEKVFGRDEIRGMVRNISFIQFNDKEEVWATVLPKTRIVIDDYHPSVMGLSSHNSIGNIECISTKRNTYVFYNDLDRKFDVTLAQNVDSFYKAEYTNAVMYKLNAKKEVTKVHLFGKQEENEYRQIYTNSGMLDETTNIYATVYLDKKGKEKTTRIAWFQLEP